MSLDDRGCGEMNYHAMKGKGGGFAGIHYSVGVAGDCYSGITIAQERGDYCIAHEEEQFRGSSRKWREGDDVC